MEFRQRVLRFESTLGWFLIALGVGVAIAISAWVSPRIQAPFIWTLGPLLGAFPLLAGVGTVLHTTQRVRTSVHGIEVDGEYFRQDDTVAFVSVASRGVDPITEMLQGPLEGLAFAPLWWLIGKLVGWTHGLQVVLSDPVEDRQATLFLPSFADSSRLEGELRRLGFSPAPLQLVC